MCGHFSLCLWFTVLPNIFLSSHYLSHYPCLSLSPSLRSVSKPMSFLCDPVHLSTVAAFLWALSHYLNGSLQLLSLIPFSLHILTIISLVGSILLSLSPLSFAQSAGISPPWKFSLSELSSQPVLINLSYLSFPCPSLYYIFTCALFVWPIHLTILCTVYDLMPCTTCHLCVICLRNLYLSLLSISLPVSPL